MALRKVRVRANAWSSSETFLMAISFLEWHRVTEVLPSEVPCSSCDDVDRYQQVGPCGECGGSAKVKFNGRRRLSFSLISRDAAAKRVLALARSWRVATRLPCKQTLENQRPRFPPQQSRGTTAVLLPPDPQSLFCMKI